MKDKLFRHRLFKCRLLQLLCCGGLLGSSDLSQAQSLLEVYQKAQGQDSQYAAARRAFEAAQEKQPQARAALLPSVNLTANKNYQSGDASFSGAPYVQRDVRTWSWTAQLTQPLLRPSSWAALGQADAQVMQAQAQLAQAEQDLLVRTAQAYLDVQVAQQSVQVARSQWQAMHEQLVLAQRSFEVGMGTITDVQEAKAKQALSLAQQVAAQNELISKQAELGKLVGEPLTLVPMQLVRGLPGLEGRSLDDWVNAATQRQPQVQAAQAALSAAQKEVSKSQAAHAPTLDLVANRAGNDSSGSLSSPADLAVKTRSHQWGLQLTIPLYAGGATQSKVRESLALAQKAQDELTSAQRNASYQAKQSFAGVMNGQAQVQALEAAVEASQNAVASNKIGFKVGTRINPDVLSAEQQLYTALRDLGKARSDAVMHGLRLKATTATLSGDDLATVDALMRPAPEMRSAQTAQ